MHFIIDGSHLPFVEVNKRSIILPSALDSTSTNISIPGGFAFGGRIMQSLFVSVG